MTNHDKPLELNDAIARLLKSGVVKITFGQNQNGSLQASAEQVLNEGAQHFMHQAVDSTAEECYNKIIRSVEHAGQLQDSIVKLPRAGKLN